MTTDEEFHELVQQLSGLSVDQLYAELAPKDLAYDLNGRVAAGREVLQRFLQSAREPLCRTYLSNKATIRDSSDLIKLLAESVKLVIAVAGLKIPVIPMAVLLFKIGIERLCPDVSRA